jgi:hypothetical protein
LKSYCFVSLNGVFFTLPLHILNSIFNENVCSSFQPNKCIRAPISISTYYILIATLSYLWCKMFCYMFIHTLDCFRYTSWERKIRFTPHKFDDEDVVGGWGRERERETKLQDVVNWYFVEFCCSYFFLSVGGMELEMKAPVSGWINNFYNASNHTTTCLYICTFLKPFPLLHSIHTFHVSLHVFVQWRRQIPCGKLCYGFDRHVIHVGTVEEICHKRKTLSLWFYCLLKRMSRDISIGALQSKRWGHKRSLMCNNLDCKYFLSLFFAPSETHECTLLEVLKGFQSRAYIF